MCLFQIFVCFQIGLLFILKHYIKNSQWLSFNGFKVAFQYRCLCKEQSLKICLLLQLLVNLHLMILNHLIIWKLYLELNLYSLLEQMSLFQVENTFFPYFSFYFFKFLQTISILKIYENLVFYILVISYHLDDVLLILIYLICSNIMLQVNLDHFQISAIFRKTINLDLS